MRPLRRYSVYNLSMSPDGLLVSSKRNGEGSLTLVIPLTICFGASEGMPALAGLAALATCAQAFCTSFVVSNSKSVIEQLAILLGETSHRCSFLSRSV